MRAAWGQLLILVAVFYIGWIAHDWHTAKLALAANESADLTRQVVTEITRQSGEVLEKKLAELKANETHTERVIRTEVIKPVFSNVCATDEYVRVFNQSVDQAERTLSGKPDDPVPGEPAPANGQNRH
ncbi:hypothetical protein KGP26_20375 [Serratia sp. JSRIV002]|uniref:hypothetical protein n=1 Tax=Serratia sp. JSRIV002 TaxID=2831894 RepID=UPI001CC1A957|nr:hypothetical protein [Serratia sp. JSRIV002]UAN50084.1 hypothetical protein KGP26_20375 [Serratia sp. JSRIV002]